MAESNADSNAKKALKDNIPNLFIAGAPKAGTTSLYNYLAIHKDIFASKVKEPWYFVFEPILNGCDHKKFMMEIYKDETEYLSLYSDRTDEKYVMDGSVVIMYYTEAMRKIREQSPDAKLIISIRNPVDRMYSHYRMLWNYDTFKLPFRKVIKNPIGPSGMDMFEIGKYYKYIKSAYEIFGPDRVCVIKYDDIATDAKSVMDKICSFLEIANIDSEVFKKRFNVHSSGIKNEKLRNILHSEFMNTMKKIFPRNFAIRVRRLFNTKNLTGEIKMADKLYKQLQERYLEDIEKTEKLTGFDLSAWKA